MELVHQRLMQDIGRMEEGDLEMIKDRKNGKRENPGCVREKEWLSKEK